MALDGAALIAEIEALESEQDRTEDTNPLPVRVVQDGLSGETVLVPLPDTNDPSYNPYLHRVACTTTPFGFPVRTREEVAARYLDPAAWFDEAVNLVSPPKIWQRKLYTSALETVVITPARTTLVREEPDLLAVGTDPGAASKCKIIEVPIEEAEPEHDAGEVPISAAEVDLDFGGSERVGVSARKRAKAAGLGKLKDYSKRKVELPNPYAPKQGVAVQGDESYRSQEAIEQSLRVFGWKPDEDDPYAMEKVLFRTPPNVLFEVGLGAKDVPTAGQPPPEDGVGGGGVEQTSVGGAGGGSRPAEPQRSSAASGSSKPSMSLKAMMEEDDDDLFDPDEEEEEEVKGDEEGAAEDAAPGVEESKAPSTAGGKGSDTAPTTDPLDMLDEEAGLGEDDDEDDVVDLDRVMTSASNLVASGPKRKASKYQRPKGAVEAKREVWCVTKLLDVSDFKALVPRMAIEYPFELDDFQKQAVARLERGEYVFVAAHTSAGKTVVAEYAISLALLHMTRAVYTSPIKALSNQKFRDFKERFGAKNVGLITGDVSVNPEANCLIMTTEILRSMLYRGADLIRDIEWVIFDEVHYVNDMERGVVWEEVIIMLPDHVSMIFLSATTPNTAEFSDWIGRTRRRPVHVVTTNYRPVPLRHHLFCGNELIKVLDQGGDFDLPAYSKAGEAFTKKEEKDKAKPGGGGGGRGGPGFGSAGRTEWQGLLNKLKKESLLPAVVFSFSKKKCEECADFLKSEDLNSAKEKSQVHLFTSSAIKRLQAKDQQLPQVQRILEMARRGVGVHHGGLLPILKEIIEILFSRGLIKVLFATETFAMGVNMPARTVVFNGLRKHDGRDFRDLLPGEYTQMAGRAGRRGLDKVGIVIITAWRELPSSATLVKMLTGTATKLSSQFRLTYNMILNLLRTEDLSVEDMIKRSFSEFATQRALGARNLPAMLEKVATQLRREKQKGLQECLRGEPDIEDYYDVSRHVSQRTTYLVQQASRLAQKGAQSLLGQGRFLRITPHAQLVNGLGLVLKNPDFGPEGLEAKQRIAVLVLCPEGFIPPAPPAHAAPPPPPTPVLRGLSGGKMGAGGAQKPAEAEGPLEVYSEAGGRKYGLIMVRIDQITFVATKRLKKLDGDTVLQQAKNRATGSALASAVDELVNCEREDKDKPLEALSFPKELKINEIDFVQDFNRLPPLQLQQSSNKCHDCPRLAVQYAHIDRIRRLEAKQANLRHYMSNESLTLFPDFQQRLGVLEALGYINADKVVQLKGRVACDVNTCEELLLAEIVFENVLDPLTPAEIAGLLSALVCQEKNQDEPSVSSSPALHEACKKVKDMARFLGHVMREYGLPTDPETYAQGVNLTLVDVVCDWAKGVSFADITAMTLVQEGSIVRCITRLDELCREVRNSARLMGNPTLYRKMEEASEAIKKDIVFAGSLYLT